MRCGAPSVQGTRAVPVKTGNLGLPKRGAGGPEGPRGENLGVPPVCLVDSEAGPSSKWPWALRPLCYAVSLDMDTGLPILHEMQMSVPLRSSGDGRAEAQTWT